MQMFDYAKKYRHIESNGNIYKGINRHKELEKHKKNRRILYIACFIVTLITIFFLSVTIYRYVSTYRQEGNMNATGNITNNKQKNTKIETRRTKVEINFID